MSDLLEQLRADARHLRALEQLRAGSPTRPAQVTRTDAAGRVHVWQARAGSFLDTSGGRWVYRDELGRVWDRATHDRVVAHLGRLPYSHTVMTPDEARQLSHLHYLRPQLNRPVLDDRQRHRRRER